MIDDYENELVEPEKIKRIIPVVEKRIKNQNDKEVVIFLHNFIALLKKAISTNRLIVFVC